jgi:hypothetical protein
MVQKTQINLEVRAMDLKKTDKNIVNATNEKSELKDSKSVNNKEEFSIPNEAGCSHEFSEGCIIREQDKD